MTLALAGFVAACAPAASTTLPVPGTAPVLVGAHNDTSTPFNLVSGPALTAHRYDGKVVRWVVGRTGTPRAKTLCVPLGNAKPRNRC